jgi:SAM-dependent methyltransferase
MSRQVIKSAGRELALRMIPPYRSIINRLAELTERVERLSQDQAAAAKAQEELVAKLEDQLRKIEDEAPALHISVTRGAAQWKLAPGVFEHFNFQTGDQLQVLPAAQAAALPNTWGDTHIQIAPGQAIRVPPVYDLFKYGGFEIPSHLIRLTGADEESFESIGLRHIELFRQYIGIEPGMMVLDLGSGIGRDAFQLFDILGPAGGFMGVDVTRDSIRWCQDNISRRHPNFRFHHFDAYNELYNPYGMLKTADFRIPLEDGSVDRIFLSSVFTHILEDEVLHYMREFRRILKPAGLVYASFFHLLPEVLESAKTKHNTGWVPTFAVPQSDGVFANDPVFPRGAVGFTDEAVRRFIAQSGLRLDRPFLKGWWSGHYGDAAEDGQDVMILGVP